MDEAKTELKEAFNLLSQIYVSGDSVEKMALAKAKLNRVYKFILEGEKQDGG